MSTPQKRYSAPQRESKTLLRAPGACWGRGEQAKGTRNPVSPTQWDDEQGAASDDKYWELDTSWSVGFRERSDEVPEEGVVSAERRINDLNHLCHIAGKLAVDN